MAAAADRGSDPLAREYRPGDERLVLDLLNQSLRSGAETYDREFWRWKHLDNPFGPSHVRYAWDEMEGRATALRALLRWRFRLPDGEEVSAVRAVDTATHPDYRRSGLFRKLTESSIADLAAEGCSFIFNTPNARSLAGYLTMGWRVVAKWPVFVRVLHPLSGFGAVLGVRRSAAGDGIWGECFGPGVLGWREFSTAFDEQIGEVVRSWERSRTRVGLRTPRDGAFLGWRYGRHPSRRYGVVHLDRDGHLEGFAIIRPNRRFGLREAVLAEIFLRPDDRDAGKRLLARLSRELRADYCVATASPATLEHRILRASRFARVPLRGILLAARPLAAAGVDPALAEGWDLSLGDLEVF